MANVLVPYGKSSIQEYIMGFPGIIRECRNVLWGIQGASEPLYIVVDISRNPGEFNTFLRISTFQNCPGYIIQK